MRKLFLFIALTLSAGLWAIDNVKYLDANGQEQTANGVTEVTDASSQVTWNAGWYVVTGTDVQLSKGAVCAGDVHLILADGAKLTATGSDIDDTPGIQVSGEGNSLTIYAQSTGDQMGKLTATGGDYGAGIGGRDGYSGSNITINGGTVEATGGNYGAGIGGGYQGKGSNIIINGGEVTATCEEYAAGIGGGSEGDGSDITINGGTVTANGGYMGAGIGGGRNGAGSNIKVATYLIVKAGGTENPTEEIATDRTDDTDIASSLAGKRYVTSKTTPWKLAIAEIEATVKGVTDEDILAIAEKAKQDINAATTVEEVNTIKNKALAELAIPIKIYNSGKAAGLAEAAAALPTDPEGTAGHTVTITKGDKTLILVNPDKVTYGKQE